MIFIVTRKSDGAEIYRYGADAPIEWHGMEFATHDHTPEPEAVTDVVPRMYGERMLDKIDFRRLFTPLEQKAIDRFNATFETHPMLTDDQKDDVRTGLENYRATSRVGLDDPDTAAVLGLYTALGILAVGRAENVLSNSETFTAKTNAFGSGAWPVTHRVTLDGVPLNAGVSMDGIVRLSNGKWTTQSSLLAKGVILEAI